MVNRLITPYPQFQDEEGDARSNYRLFFYTAGTSTKADTFQDSAFAVANANPLTLNSLGQPSTAVFMQNLAYKIVLAPPGTDDPPNSPVWTADNVWTSDFSARAKLTSYSGNPNGFVAGTAGSSTVAADMIWDFVGNILYVCTTTGASPGATVWTAVNASTAAAVVPPPPGRLTLTSGAPITTADVTGATSVYYMPFVASVIPIYNGASSVPTQFGTMTLALVGSHLANTNYDVWVANDSGAVIIGTGPAWQNATGRGTGAGTTELQRLGGVYVNAVDITLRNGSTTYAVLASQATCVGTIRTTGSAGQTEDSMVKRFVSNMYNQQPRPMARFEATDSWVYATSTVRQANGAAANLLDFVNTLAERPASATVMAGATAATVGGVVVGVGVDSTTAFSGLFGLFNTTTDTKQVSGSYRGFPGLGRHYLAWLEYASGSNTFTGDSGAPTLVQSGIFGEVWG